MYYYDFQQAICKSSKYPIYTTVSTTLCISVYHIGVLLPLFSAWQICNIVVWQLQLHLNFRIFWFRLCNSPMFTVLLCDFFVFSKFKSCLAGSIRSIVFTRIGSVSGFDEACEMRCEPQYRMLHHYDLQLLLP